MTIPGLVLGIQTDRLVTEPEDDVFSMSYPYILCQGWVPGLLRWFR